MEEKKTLDKKIRSSLAGTFIQLSNGIVHYELGGPEDGEQIVLVCGLVTPLFGWDATFGALVEAGYRVLRYDLFGRGFSDRPELKYEPEVFVQQLHELISALKFEKKVILAGWSMGGAISMYYARKYPDKVSKLVLVASAGFPPKLPLAVKLLTLPGIGKWLMSKVGEKSTFAALKGHFSNPEKFPEYYEKSKVQLQYKGFKRTLLSTLANFPFNDLPPLVAEVGKHPRSVLLIWGKKDEITPYEGAIKFKESMPQLELLDFEEAKHAVHYEHSQEVNQRIIAFLNS